MNEIFHLSSLSGDSIPALTLGQGLPGKVNGVPAFYYWRKSAKDGKYIHPTKGFELSIDADRRRKWEVALKESRKAGADIPVVEDHKESAAKTLGYVIDARNNGEWYEELHQYIGESARDTALKNRISIGIDPDFKDGTGKRYGEAIRHSALTPIPVIPGTGDAEPLLASRGAVADSDIFVLAASLDRSADMALLQKLREVFGAAELSEDELIAKVSEQKNSLAAAANDLRLSRDEHKADKDKLATAESRIVELSRKPSPPDPEALLDRADLVIGKIELSMAKGDMPPSIGKKLIESVKPQGKPSAYLLSREDSINARPAEFILGLFTDQKLGVQTGTRTGVQTLSREVPGDEAKVDPEFVKQRAQAVQ